MDTNTTCRRRYRLLGKEGERVERGKGERGGRHTHTQRGPTPPLHTLTCCYPTRLDLYSASALYALALALSRCDDFWLEAWNYLGLMLRARKRTGTGQQ